MKAVKQREFKGGGDWVLLVRYSAVLSPVPSQAGVASSGTDTGEFGSNTRAFACDNSNRNGGSRLDENSSESAFCTTYQLLGPLLQFVQDSRCGATSCFIGSTRITSGNCRSHTPGIAAASASLLPRRVALDSYSAERRSTSLLLPHAPETVSSSNNVPVATKYALARPTGDAERATAGRDMGEGARGRADGAASREVMKTTRAMAAPEMDFPTESTVPGALSKHAAAEGGTSMSAANAAGAQRRSGTSMGPATARVASAGAMEGSTVRCDSGSNSILPKQKDEKLVLTTDKATEEEVTAIEYEAYEPMALQQLRAACLRVRIAFPGIVKISVMHLLGLCKLGHPGLIIFVSAPHRQESQNGCALLVELIKHHAPIWKFEWLVSPKRSAESCIDSTISNENYCNKGNSGSRSKSARPSRHSLEIHKGGSERAGGSRSRPHNSGHSLDSSSRDDCHSVKGGQNTLKITATTLPAGGTLTVHPSCEAYSAGGDAYNAAFPSCAPATAASADAVSAFMDASNIGERRTSGRQTQSPVHQLSSARSATERHRLQEVTQCLSDDSKSCRKRRSSPKPAAGPFLQTCSRTLGDAVTGEELWGTYSKKRIVQGHTIQSSLPLMSGLCHSPDFFSALSTTVLPGCSADSETFASRAISKP